MNEAKFLKMIQDCLKNASFDCVLQPDLRAPPFGRLLVFLGTDQQGREKVMEITAQFQDLGEALQTPASSPHFIRVQFEICLPFTCQASACSELASLVTFLNRMLEIPGFELDEVNGKVFYRYVHLDHIEGEKKTVINGIIGAASLLTELFSELIESVAIGKRSFNQILEEMLQNMETVK